MNFLPATSQIAKSLRIAAPLLAAALLVGTPLHHASAADALTTTTSTATSTKSTSKSNLANGILGLPIGIIKGVFSGVSKAARSTVAEHIKTK